MYRIQMRIAETFRIDPDLVRMLLDYGPDDLEWDHENVTAALRRGAVGEVCTDCQATIEERLVMQHVVVDMKLLQALGRVIPMTLIPQPPEPALERSAE
jgi:hypothetical protein